nr:uncharacterized protein LOC116433068 [Nomia melanderi]
MSREVLSHVCSLALFLSILRKASPSTVLPVDCLEFDIGELEDYLSEVHLENVPTIDMMIGEFKCPATALPFGALRSDWARLLLLQRAQPEGSILREKLGRLFRILAVAHFRPGERFDITKLARPTASSRTVPFARGTTSREEAEGYGRPIHDSRETNKTAGSFTSSTAPGSEHFHPREVEETTLAGSNAAEVDGEREATDGIRNDPPLTGVTSIGEKTSSNGPTNSIGENQNYSDNNPTNGTINEGSRRTSQRPTEAERGMNGAGGTFLTVKPFSTSQGPVKGQSSANDAQNESGAALVKVGSTADHFRGVEHAADAFVGAKSSGVAAQVDAAGFEPITFPVSESNTFGTVPGSSTFSLNSVGDHKSRTMNLEGEGEEEEEEEEEEEGAAKGGEGIKESGFAGNIQTTTTEIAEADPRNMTAGAGDHPQFYTPMNPEDQENTVDTGVESLTTGYRGVAGSNSGEFADTSDPGMSDVKSTIGSSHDRIPGNDVSTRSYPGRQPARQGSVFGFSPETPRNSTNSAADPDEIRVASVSREPTLDREFWRSIVISRNVTEPSELGARGPRVKDHDRGQDKGGKRLPAPPRSGKRGSLNTDVEKNFRWFYNIGREKKEYASDDRRGIRIECNGDGHDNGRRVS